MNKKIRPAVTKEEMNNFPYLSTTFIYLIKKNKYYHQQGKRKRKRKFEKDKSD